MLADCISANLLTLILFAPWLPTSIAQIFAQPNLAQSLPFAETLRLLWGNLVYGGTFELTLRDMGFVAAFFLLFGLLPAAGRRSWWTLLLPVLWVLISIAAYLNFELSTRYLRFLLPAQLGVALWMGRGVWMLWSRQTRDPSRWLRLIPKLAAVVALLAYLLTQFKGLESLYHHPDFQRDDMRGLVGRIQADLGENDALIVSAAGLKELLSYYYRGDAPVFALPTGTDADRTRAQVLEIIAGYERLHVIFYGAAEQDPNLVVETTLNLSAFEISDTWVDDLRYVVYAAATQLKDPRQVDLGFGDEIVLQSYALSGETVAAGDVLRLQFVWRAEATPSQRYKVFLQLLDVYGALVVQRDSEPAAGSAMTTGWKRGERIVDNHGLLIPRDLPSGEYRLIAGLYDAADPAARLEVNGETYLELGVIRVDWT